MQSSLCLPCRTIIKARFRHKVRSLRDSRRSASFKSWYWDTTPPSDRQLAAARWFFKQHPPRKLWTATEWRKHNDDATGVLVPEVAFLGRSNVGKSSLLNAVLDTPGLNWVGPRPGKTTLMHAWGLSATDPKTGGALKGWKGLTDTRVAVLDAPGYGYASRKDWGNEIVTYLTRRKQLRRVFVLIDAVHGIKKHDRQMLDLLRETRIPHQLIASKIDRQKDLDTSLRALQEFAQPRSTSHALTGLGEILAVGGLEDTPKAKPCGVTDVQWAVLRAAGLDDFAVDNFSRLSTKEALSHSATPRKPNAQSHLGQPEMVQRRPLSAPAAPPEATVTVAARKSPPPSGLRTDSAETRMPRHVSVPDSPVPPNVAPETAPPTQLNPSVFRGMDALEQAVGLASGAKGRSRGSAPKRGGRNNNNKSGTQRSRGKPSRVRK